MYSERLLDHFQNPRNVGDIAEADAVAEIENPACGDVLRLSLKLDGSKTARKIITARFKAKGCVPAMACGSALTVLLEHKTLAEAQKLSRGDVIEAVGGVPQASMHAAQLAIDTLTTALHKIKTSF